MSINVVDHLLAKLQGVRQSGDGWTSICPNHDDRKASLTVGQGEDGRVLLKCHAQCPTEQIVGALGLEWSDLFEQSHGAPSSNGTGQKMVAEYTYHDETGTPVSQTVRLDPKDFRQRHSDGNGGWHWGLGGDPKKCNCPRTQLVPYRLPELLAADPKETAIIVEGEKDADQLWELGLIATTNPMGAGKCSDVYAGWLKDRPVLILPDNDVPGRKHAEQIARSLYGVAKSVRVLALPGLPEKGDVSDWLDQGHTPEELSELAQNTPEWSLTESDTSNHPSLESACAGQMRVDDDTVIMDLSVGEDAVLQIRASDIKKTPTGVHARLEMTLKDVLLGFNTGNVERDEERQRFSNKCHRRLSVLWRDGYEKEILNHDLDIFCRKLWQTYIAANVASELEGNPDLALRFLLKPYVLDGGGTILFAPPGRGKSYTGLLMAVSIDANVPRQPYLPV